MPQTLSNSRRTGTKVQILLYWYRSTNTDRLSAADAAKLEALTAQLDRYSASLLYWCKSTNTDAAQLNSCFAALRGESVHTTSSEQKLGGGTDGKKDAKKDVGTPTPTTAALRLFALLSEGHMDAETAERNRKVVLSHPLLLPAVKCGFEMGNVQVKFKDVLLPPLPYRMLTYWRMLTYTGVC